MELLKRIQELELEKTGQYSKPYSVLQVSQFYGIEIDDFAHEIAILSLWLAEHQINIVFKDELGESLPSLPLKASGNIICENATRMDWDKFCVKDTDVFVFGNPPYRGKKEQTEQQKKDLDYVCRFLDNYKTLDFIACWFIKVTQYIHLANQVESAFVSTNSITQGEQVGILWPYIFKHNIEIHFAYTSFMWKNNARDPAGVAVVIIGLRNALSSQQNKKYLFIDNEVAITKKLTSKINPYLTAGNDIIVKKRSVPISNLPEMCNGSMANDDGYFFKTLEEFQQLPLEIQKFYKQAMGAKEFYYDQKRYCLWLDDSNLNEALKIDKIQEITTLVKNYRNASTRDATRKLASVPHRFGEVRYKESPALIVPGLSAESREYFPIGYVDKDVIITNLAQAVYSAEPWLFALLSSKMNIVWIQATSGYFKKDLRYSPILSYNNFPVPNLSDAQKENLTESAFNILSCREKYVGKTIAYLYHPKTMPSDLKQAHLENDLFIDSYYRNKPFINNEERLETLFNLYEKLIKEGNNK